MRRTTRVWGKSWLSLKLSSGRWRSFPLSLFPPFFFFLSLSSSLRSPSFVLSLFLSFSICISRQYIPTVYAHTICLSRENIYRSHEARQLIYESETLRSIPVYVHLRLIKSPTNLGFPLVRSGHRSSGSRLPLENRGSIPLALHPPPLINYSFP